MARAGWWSTWGLGFVVPVALIAFILIADALEGPKTAYVGVLAVVPVLAAVFATPVMTAVVAVITWLSGWAFGLAASDGNVTAQTVRLIIIAVAGVAAVGAAALRVRRERALTVAQHEAARAHELEVQAQSDELTGVLNRFGLDHALGGQLSARHRSVALLDCDHLKDINDGLGHLAGDAYLKAIAGRIQHALPSSDLVARWGGDEFIVIQDRPAGEAAASLSRVQQSIADTPISLDGTQVHGSVSVGIADWPAHTRFDDALSAADDALYAAKAEGRNRVTMAPVEPPTMPG